MDQYVECLMFNEANPLKPPGLDRYAREVEQISRAVSIPLRLVWAPEITSIKWGQSHRTYCCRREEKLRGWWEGHKEQDVFKAARYRRPNAYGAIGPYAQQLPNGKWIHPDLNVIEYAWPRWIIERRLQDSERLNHDRERYEWVNGVRVDALGPWPEGGKWALERVIAHHFLLCCQQAEQEFLEGKRPTGLCFGQYRPPADEDMETLRADIVRGDRTGLTATPTFEQAVEYDTKQTMDQSAEAERRQQAHYREVIQNALAPALRMPKLRPFLDAIEKAGNT
jgi:hypothetical protein